MNDCPVCGVEYDERVGGSGDRTPSIETEGSRRVCAKVRYDKHNYGYAEMYVHDAVGRVEA